MNYPVTVSQGASLALGNASESVTGFVVQNATRIDLEVWDATTGTTSMLLSELSAGGGLSVSGFYEV